MTTWKLQPNDKNKIETRTTWVNGETLIVCIETVKSGLWELKSDSRPDIDTNNSSGYNIYKSGLDWSTINMEFGHVAAVQYPDYMENEKKEKIQKTIEEEGLMGLFDEGWTNVDSEIIVYGPLQFFSEVESESE